MSSSPSLSRLRVRYAETDQMGVVYYANYLVWFEVGRTDLLRESGWNYREMETEGFGLPVIEAHCIYRESAKYDDEIEIRRRHAQCAARIAFDVSAFARHASGLEPERAVRPECADARHVRSAIGVDRR